MLRYFLLWFPMLMLAIINGSARDLWYKKHIGELAARQVSTLSLIILFGCYFIVINKYFPPSSAKQALHIGLFWLILTLIFEFGFGRYRGNSWQQLFDDYNIAKGHLWILIPIWVAVGPYVISRIFQH